jgi:hypothetical protein
MDKFNTLRAETNSFTLLWPIFILCIVLVVIMLGYCVLYSAIKTHGIRWAQLPPSPNQEMPSPSTNLELFILLASELLKLVYLIMVLVNLLFGSIVSIMLVSLVQILAYSALTLAILLELNAWMQLKCHLKAAVGLIGPVESSRILDKHLMIYSICFFATIILNLVAIINSVLSAKNIAEASS